MADESVRCALCGSDRSERVVSASDWSAADRLASIDFQVVRCLDCGLHFQNPRPTAVKLKNYYPPHYYAYRSSAGPSPIGLAEISHNIEWRTKQAVRQAFWGYPCSGGWLGRWVLQLLFWPLWLRLRLLGKDLKVVPCRGQGRFLDVGCGTGGDLAYHRRYGLAVTGVEMDPGAAQLAREQHELDVRAGTLEEAELSDRSFDVIHMSHVFEHLPNPAVSLDAMHRLLDEGGMVILKVPNVASVTAARFGRFWLGWDLPRHLYHFSPGTITALLERHGFIVRRIRHDPGSWSYWRESRRFQARAEGRRALFDGGLQDRLDQSAEWLSCWRGRGSVLVVYAQKRDTPTRDSS